MEICAEDSSELVPGSLYSLLNVKGGLALYAPNCSVVLGTHRGFSRCAWLLQTMVACTGPSTFPIHSAFLAQRKPPTTANS